MVTLKLMQHRTARAEIRWRRFWKQPHRALMVGYIQDMMKSAADLGQRHIVVHIPNQELRDYIKERFAEFSILTCDSKGWDQLVEDKNKLVFKKKLSKEEEHDLQCMNEVISSLEAQENLVRIGW